MDDCYEVYNNDDVFTVFDLKNIPIDESSNEDVIFSMTSLGNLILGQNRAQQIDNKTKNHNTNDDDLHLQRLSLAYERLHQMPKILLHELAATIKILDISYNEFNNLDFLNEFTELTSLICDHNNITSDTNLPFMPKLELLWLNHCKINELNRFVRKLQCSCPNLKYLSLMGNQAAPSYLNGGNFYEYLQYRFFIIALFPNLMHLDDRIVTNDQRVQAKKMFQLPIIDRILTSTQKTVPNYVRCFINKCTEVLTPPPSYSEKNGVI